MMVTGGIQEQLPRDGYWWDSGVVKHADKVTVIPNPTTSPDEGRYHRVA